MKRSIGVCVAEEEREWEVLDDHRRKEAEGGKMNVRSVSKQVGRKTKFETRSGI